MGNAALDLDDIKTSFEFFDDWEDRYRFVIDLGKQISDLDEARKTDDNLVRGCQSQVWLVSSYDPATDLMTFEMDSDAHIVRGLIAIVLAAYDGRRPADILALDILAVFDELSLLSHLSPTRGNGLRAMVARVRDLASLAQ